MKGKIILLLLVISMQSMAQEEVLYVPNIQTDFIPDGKASNEHWQSSSWILMPKIDTIYTPYTTRFKVLYSTKGMYVFFEGTDTKVTSSYRKDFSDMYKADVFEVFLHPQPEMPLYFEYEINPFNKELVLLIPNLRKGIAGWQPWHYTGAKKTIKKVHIQRENGKMTGWSAEVFIPFSLLSPLENNPPKKGTTWKGTFCRLDYDSGKMIKWSWAPIKVGFHEYKNYWTIVFD
ncbi:MAG: carbohydrate-binding family 9-like protein [Sphingobacteriales bacterium]|jgi:hypothetical protein